ncbi:hypothetical protein OPKNFCMD_5731 [Methylobacterium crusticola]|uniref:Uncharacterized protein n=1 Tax=Methylobacterium crusticola TaxID=1697972 RepID=A0ABQ4R5K6_9HYPH|nr:hypothetical protein [Methylobacterium crusticola]GJD52963.1 hypothetical protein OPKNFCMD_5731 [Methylobacterium crusticola]
MIGLLRRLRWAAGAAPAAPQPRREPVLDWYGPAPAPPARDAGALRRALATAPAPRPDPDREARRRRLTIEEAEAELGAPAGNERWRDMRAAMRPGDALWAFCSPMAEWRALAGRKGVALVRDGRTVMEIITMLN